MLLSRVHRPILEMLILPIHSWTVFLVAVESFRKESLSVPTILHFARVEIEGEEDVDKKW